MARSGRRGERAEEMRAALERWQRSGLPLSRFAEREGIGRKTLYRWRLRLGVGGRRLRPGRPKRALGRVGREGSTPMFTEVAWPGATGGLSATRFEVELRDGTTIRVPVRFDACALRALLQTLRQC